MSLVSYRTKCGGSSTAMNMRSNMPTRLLSASTNFKIGSDDDEVVFHKASNDKHIASELFTVEIPSQQFAGTLSSPV